MPIDLARIPARLTEAAKSGNVVPFLGAGVSRQAITGDPKAFPTWTVLLQELGQIAEREGHVSAGERAEIDNLVSRGKFLMAAQAIKSELPADLLEGFLQKRFLPPEAKPGPLHRTLFKLKAPLILTTNYDLLLEDAYASEYQKTLQTVTWKDAPLVQRFLQGDRPWMDRPLVFKIHGSAASPSDAILAEMDYRNLLYREPGYRTVLSAIFVTKVILMLGFSFTDPELTALTESLRESLKHRSSPDYIVLPRGEKGSVERSRLREDFGLEVIEYEPSEGHPELQQLIEYLATFVPAHPRSDGSS